MVRFIMFVVCMWMIVEWGTLAARGKVLMLMAGGGDQVCGGWWVAGCGTVVLHYLALCTIQETLTAWYLPNST